MVHASEQDRPDVQIKRKHWVEMLDKMDTDRLVFLDESGININMTRRYGRSKGKQRVVDSTPLNTPKTTTLLSSIRLDGSTIPMVFQGALNKERFLEYLRNYLVPNLRKGDIVVMDNLGSHKVAGVAELIRSVGAVPLYLPPYSPDFNPIEKMWSKLKAFFRKWKLRSTDLLLAAVPHAFSLVSASDCHGWFSAAGYCHSL